jgi:hypothetical protein
VTAPEIDMDDWLKETCACSHRRHRHEHNSDQCQATTTIPDYNNLPAPRYPDDAVPDCTWPDNWPAPDLIPRIETPCPCTSVHFDEPDPAEAWPT